MEESWLEKLLNRLQEQSLVALVVWAVILTSLASLILNLFSSSHFGADADLWLERWLADFSTDLAGAGVAFLFVKFFLERRDKQQAPSNEKSLVLETTPPTDTQPKTFTYFVEAEQVQPVTQAAENSPVQEVVEEVEIVIDELLDAIKASETPEARQVHLDRVRGKDIFISSTLIGLNLQRADLSNINLSNAQLVKANLREAVLRGTNLQGANLKETQLIEADLEGADLTDANLEHTFLSGAILNGATLVRAKIATSLWGASLVNANLQDADLSGAELFKTNLTGANLQGAKFEDAKFSTDMILPDGTKWNEKTDITRFTDPEHEDFWRSEDPASPASSVEVSRVRVDDLPNASIAST